MTATTKLESGVATRQRLLEAAESLFSEEGFDRVSVRDVTVKAGANVAAVNYHFGSREGLVDQVMMRYVGPINEERLARLDALERKVGGKALPLEEILDAFVRPFVTQVRRSDLSEKLFYKLMGRIFGDQSAKIPEILENDFGAMIERFLKSFKKTLPGLDDEELLWRIHFTVGAMIHTMAHSESLHRISKGKSGNPSMDQTLSRFIRYTAAGMREGLEKGDGDDPAKGPQSEFLF